MSAPTPRVVCVSGGTSGIGAALVGRFLELGARVYTFGRDPERLARLRAAHPEAVVGERLLALVGDATDAAFRAHLVEEIGRREGRLDVLVNNAGVILDAGTLEAELDQWRATLEVNLVAPFALTQCAAALLEHSTAPVVINLSSACAGHPFASCTSTSYSVSKAGLDMLTQRLALALGERGIRVNGVAPGVVDSEMWGEARALMAETVARRHVLGGQVVRPEDVADAVEFLASARARLITGATLKVDAGYTLG
ncbi:SDR family NAD(P)-dependent oxidoreductase [Marichromatium bheemlicum]|uniref:SDR family oxidoreductase n=1 Tax=Marichromatium bheemlicum TaxID=365339 RepID=A0ABX1IB89_9GAMM|nr:SDR family oxidoreductase [Marichromatium bheemlicum]NKN34533.1 SDR family oxidoreductase [Marichromatium bheemlicum]